MSKIFRVLCSCALVASFPACGADSIAPQALDYRIELQSVLRFVAVKATTSITARAFVNNQSVPAPSLAWTSSDPSIATVDAFGRVTGQRIGLVQIRATTADGVEGSIGMEVRPAEIRIVLQSGQQTMLPGETAILQAIPEDALGDPIPATDVIGWQSSDSNAVTVRPIVSSAGREAQVTAITGGLTFLTAWTAGVRVHYVVPVVSRRPPPNPALQIADFGFFEFDNFFGALAVGPVLRVMVNEGRAADILRADLLLPGSYTVFPPLCSTVRLPAGQYDILRPQDFSEQANASFRFDFPQGLGVVLLTYRADDGNVYGVSQSGPVAYQDYPFRYGVGYTWKPCGA